MVCEINMYTGKMNTKARDKEVTEFNTLSGKRIFLVSLTAGGTGLSLHYKCSTLVITEPYWYFDMA